MRFALLILCLLSQYPTAGQDFCSTFGSIPEVKMMGMYQQDVYWKSMQCVVHIHYTDSVEGSYIPIDIVEDAILDLNEDFLDAQINFNLEAVEYHNFDDFLYAPLIHAADPHCFPGSWTLMNLYTDPIAWDPWEYLNIHVFPDFCTSTLGFAFLYHIENNSSDGVWIQYNCFGRYGDHLMENRDENKTLIHEVGHYCGLYHVFQNVEFCGQDLGACDETGDRVCDTPPMKINWSCETPICPPSWNPSQPWSDYEHNNHMDYYVDSCRTTFTEGQISRMHGILSIWRPGVIGEDEQEPFCYADINGDFAVGMMDLLLMLEHWGETDWLQGDVTGDGFFTILDYLQVLQHFGTVCEGAEPDPFYREEQFDKSKLERGLSPFPFR